MTSADLPATRRWSWSAADSLWVAALGIQFIVLGHLLLPGFIRLLGRGGAVETVEWAIWMSTLVAFPPAVWIVGRWLPRVAGERPATLVRRALVLAVVAEFVIYAALRATPLLVLASIVASATAGAILFARRRDDTTTLLLALACGTGGWLAAGGLVYWENALDWLLRSPATIALVVSAVLVAVALRGWVLRSSDDQTRLTPIDFLFLAFLVAFSFRTFPMVEFFHWGFFVGPIEQLRQGGTLLWDTPSQYGFLSILLPTLLPGNAWQSFWFFQGVAYAIVAGLMYVAIRRLAPGVWSALAALAITFTTLFFRPRSESLLLPAQMTPAAGPFRFIWCFVMLAFLVRWYRGGRRETPRRFAVTGSIIWVVSVLWSAETAIYVTAIWFPALVIHSLQVSASSDGRQSLSRSIAAVMRGLAIPLAAVVVVVVIAFVVYRIAFGLGPDFMSYLDYVILYSSGRFGALPIDPTGIVWYLILSFLVVSSLLALHALHNPRDSRLVVWAAAWGAVWSIASYFTGRSHPVNLVAIVPVLIYALVICLRLQPFERSARARSAIATVMLPLLAMPVTLTAGHRSFTDAVAEPQLPPARFTDQVITMEPDLQALLQTAGARPTDAFVLVGDGRLMLPAWDASRLPTAAGNRKHTRMLTTRSWMPKAFEIVGSLPGNRRHFYFDRNSRSFPGEGWLIHSKSLDASGAGHFLGFVESRRREESRAENERWIVRRMGPAVSPAR